MNFNKRKEPSLVPQDEPLTPPQRPTSEYAPRNKDFIGLDRSQMGQRGDLSEEQVKARTRDPAELARVAQTAVKDLLKMPRMQVAEPLQAVEEELARIKKCAEEMNKLYEALDKQLTQEADRLLKIARDLNDRVCGHNEACKEILKPTLDPDVPPEPHLQSVADEITKELQANGIVPKANKTTPTTASGDVGATGGEPKSKGESKA